MVIPNQPWIDGFITKTGTVSQFVAAPLGSGFTVEGQVSGEEKEGGLQMEVFPLKKDKLPPVPKRVTRGVITPKSFNYCCDSLEVKTSFATPAAAGGLMLNASPQSMGMAAGGRMVQEIYPDPYGIGSWETQNRFKVFIHIFHAKDMEAITGEPHPDEMTPDLYKRHNYPWYLGKTGSTLPSKGKLGSVKTVAQLAEEKGYGLHPDLMPPEPLVKEGIPEGNWDLSRGSLVDAP